LINLHHPGAGHCSPHDHGCPRCRAGGDAGSTSSCDHGSLEYSLHHPNRPRMMRNQTPQTLLAFHRCNNLKADIVRVKSFELTKIILSLLIKAI